MDELKKQAEDLGIRVGERWTEGRIREEIEALQKPKQDQKQKRENTYTVRNLKANPMKSLGLASYGTVAFTETQLATDPSIDAKIRRGVELGILSIA